MILLIIFLAYYLKTNKGKVKNAIKGLFYGTSTILFLFFFWIIVAKIPIENILVQYFHYPMSIGDTRIGKIKFDLNSFFFQFKFIYLSLLIPLTIFLNLKRS